MDNETDLFDFSAALTIVKNGGVVARAGWNGGLTMGVMAPPQNSGLMPFLALRQSDGMVMAWSPGQADMFCVDWCQAHIEKVGHG